MTWECHQKVSTKHRQKKSTGHRRRRVRRGMPEAAFRYVQGPVEWWWKGFFC